jgi:hypothetical protein
MSALEIIILVSLFLSIVLNFIVARYAYNFSLIIIKVEDALEECLDILEEKHLSLVEISEKDIFFDSPEVREAVSLIGESKDAVHYVATVALGAISEEYVIEEDEDEG